MPFTKQLPSQEIIRQLLDYNPDTGELIWRRRPEGPENWNVKYAGQRAGSHNRQIRVHGKIYLISHIIWVHHNGRSFPPGMEIIYRDRDPSNNKISNLILMTSSQRRANSRVRKDNKLGVTGVTLVCRKYRATVSYQGKTHFLGTFRTLEAAQQIRQAAFKQLYGEARSYE